MNMDYSLCEAIKAFKQCNTALVIYDICCQWSIYFRERVDRNQFLDLADEFDLVAAVGKWHLGAHIRECFYRFSLNFITGAAQVDGEILETLWSVMDKVAPMTRTASRAYRQEVIDDTMNDGNWKKLVRCGM